MHSLATLHGISALPCHVLSRHKLRIFRPQYQTDYATRSDGADVAIAPLAGIGGLLHVDNNLALGSAAHDLLVGSLSIPHTVLAVDDALDLALLKPFLELGKTVTLLAPAKHDNLVRYSAASKPSRAK